MNTESHQAKEMGSWDDNSEKGRGIKHRGTILDLILR